MTNSCNVESKMNMDSSNTCPHCQVCLKSRSNLLCHVRDNHNNDLNMYCHLCTECCSGAYSDLDMEMHLFLNHNLLVYKCTLCLFSANKIAEIVDHFSKIHDDLGDVTPHKLLKFIQRPLSLSYINIVKSLLNDLLDYEEHESAVYECSVSLTKEELEPFGDDATQNMQGVSSSMVKAETIFAGSSNSDSLNNTKLSVVSDNAVETVNIALQSLCGVSNKLADVTQCQILSPSGSVPECADMQEVYIKEEQSMPVEEESIKAHSNCTSEAITLTMEQVVQFLEGTPNPHPSENGNRSSRVLPSVILDNCTKESGTPRRVSSNKYVNQRFRNYKRSHNFFPEHSCSPVKVPRAAVKETSSPGRHLRNFRTAGRNVTSADEVVPITSENPLLTEGMDEEDTPKVIEVYKSNRSCNGAHCGHIMKLVCVRDCDVDDGAKQEKLLSSSGESKELNDSHGNPCATEEANEDAFVQLGFSKWPEQYRLNMKEFPYVLRRALDAKSPIQGKLRRMLVESLYNDIIRYTYFPTHSNYDEVVRCLLTTYPYLYKDIAYTDAKRYWRALLSTKARNARQHRDRNVPCVQASRDKKVKVIADSNALSVVAAKAFKKKTPASVFPNHLPLAPETGTEESAEELIELMRTEYVKSDGRDSEKINNCMAQTFPHRRRDIVTKSMGMEQIKKIYPALFDSNQVCSEFHRLSDIDVVTEMRTKVFEYSKSILQLSGVKERTWRDSVAGLAAEVQDEMLACLALKEVPKLLKEPFDFNEPPTNISAPMLHFSGDASLPGTEGTLVAEGVQICRFKGLLMGVTLWLSAYYVFNYSYPIGCKRTLAFLQKAMLGLKYAHKSQATVALLNLIQKLNYVQSKIISEEENC